MCIERLPARYIQCQPFFLDYNNLWLNCNFHCYVPLWKTPFFEIDKYVIIKKQGLTKWSVTIYLVVSLLLDGFAYFLKELGCFWQCRLELLEGEAPWGGTVCTHPISTAHGREYLTFWLGWKRVWRTPWWTWNFRIEIFCSVLKWNVSCYVATFYQVHCKT